MKRPKLLPKLMGAIRQNGFIQLARSVIQTPLATKGLLVICTMVYSYEVMLYGLSPTTQQLYDLGGLTPADWADVNEWWRIGAFNFLHANSSHYLNNMFALLYMGSVVEGRVGLKSMVVLVAISCVGTSVGAVAGVEGSTVIVGVSGVIAALIGFGLVLDYRAKTIVGILAWIFLLENVVYVFYAHNLSTGGHIAGLLVGIAYGWLFRFGKSV